MKKKTVRIGVIGFSARASGMLGLLLDVQGVVCPAVCDTVSERATNGVAAVKSHPSYTGYEVYAYNDYKELLQREALDAVYVATTWITHVPIAVDAMKAGCHVGLEVGGAASIEECWRLVRTSEETGKFCMLMENCCYDRKEMALFKMVREGLFGEIVHCEGGYRHDLCDEICLGRENIHGRLNNFMRRNGELYPTHQLGPICKLLNINRGNRMISLVSMASKARGLNEWIEKNKGKDYDLCGYPFNEGDVVTTLIKCANGETITLTHDCSLPRPYCRDYCIQGTKGIFKEATENELRFALEGVTESTHQFENFGDRLEEFEHPLWDAYQNAGVKQGHGGMDFLVVSAFAEAVALNAAPPIDVYDTAAWMAITCLSEDSIAMGSAPVAIPDFTNGMWIGRAPYRRGKYCLEEVCYDFFENTQEAECEP